jgi:hypothetical protein
VLIFRGSFQNSFDNAYGNQAGTYTRPSTSSTEWTKQ